MALKDGDIITLDYEGRTDGVLFDTTLEKVAKKEDSVVENRVYAPITVVVGDGRGHIGVGLGKANEVISAIQKAKEAAKQHIVKISLINGTIPHKIIGKLQFTLDSKTIIFLDTGGFLYFILPSYMDLPTK